MTARTHDLAAFTALCLAVVMARPGAMSLATILLCLLANQIGGVLPDIDQPTAPLWRNLPIGHVAGKLVGQSLGGHRFLTHSILGVALFGFLTRALLGWLTPLLHHADTGYIWWAFMIGLISHLLMDTITKEGVPWLLPIPHKFGIPPIKALRVTTGKAVEKLIVLPGLLVITVAIIASNYPYFQLLLQRGS